MGTGVVFCLLISQHINTTPFLSLCLSFLALSLTYTISRSLFLLSLSPSPSLKLLLSTCIDLAFYRSRSVTFSLAHAHSVSPSHSLPNRHTLLATSILLSLRLSPYPIACSPLLLLPLSLSSFSLSHTHTNTHVRIPLHTFSHLASPSASPPPFYLFRALFLSRMLSLCFSLVLSPSLIFLPPSLSPPLCLSLDTPHIPPRSIEQVFSLPLSCAPRALSPSHLYTSSLCVVVFLFLFLFRCFSRSLAVWWVPQHSSASEWLRCVAVCFAEWTSPHTQTWVFFMSGLEKYGFSQCFMWLVYML